MIDKLFPIGDTVCGIIMWVCILLLILYLMVLYILDEYRIVRKRTHIQLIDGSTHNNSVQHLHRYIYNDETTVTAINPSNRDFQAN
jgi:hypothetical protein